MTCGDGRRPVRSFMRRAGRVTRAQNRALSELWPRYGLGGEGMLDLEAVFGRRASRFLEIGFGMGEALAELAATHPDRDYLGVEVHEAGIGRLLWLLEERGLTNVRVLRADAVELLRSRIGDAALDGVLVFFPDPWPKKRHHKRRLVQADFLTLVARKLRAGAILRLATDWAPYAEQMLEALEAHAHFHNLAGVGCFGDPGGERVSSKFERRGERLGHRIFDLAFRRV